MTVNGLPVLAAALEANTITGQASDGRRFVAIRENDKATFPTVQWLGLKDRDTIDRVNGIVIGSRQALLNLVKDVKPGVELTLSVSRDGKQRTHVVQVDPAPLSTDKVAQAAPPDDTMLVREDEIEKVWANQDPWALLVTAAPEMVRDTNGKVAGVTSDAFGDIPLTRMLGFQNGDIVQSVNGYPIDSEQAIFDLVNKLDGQRFFSVRVIRNGRPITLKYRVE